MVELAVGVYENVSEMIYCVAEKNRQFLLSIWVLFFVTMD